jgi:hypothetical protein
MDYLLSELPITESQISGVPNMDTCSVRVIWTLNQYELMKPCGVPITSLGDP